MIGYRAESPSDHLRAERAMTAQIIYADFKRPNPKDKSPWTVEKAIEALMADQLKPSRSCSPNPDTTPAEWCAPEKDPA